MKRIARILLSLVISLSVVLGAAGCSDGSVQPWKLYAQLNDFIAASFENGLNEELENKWILNGGAFGELDYDALSGRNGMVNYASLISHPPLATAYREYCSGFSTAVLYEFCKEYGYGLVGGNYGDVSSIMMALKTGRGNIGGGCVSVTEERKRNAVLSSAYYYGSVSIAIRKEDHDKYFNNVEGLNGKRVLISKVGGLYSSLSDKLDKTVLGLVDTVTDLMYALREKTTDAIVDETAVLKYVIKDFSDELELFDFDTAGRREYVFCFNKFGFQSVDELKGKSTGVIRGSGLAGVPGTTVTEFSSEEELKSALASDRIAAAVVNNSVRDSLISTTDRAYYIPESSGGGSIVCYAGSGSSQKGFFEDIADGFYSTFIEQDRWLMYLGGVGLTILIAVMSLIIGTVLGFAVYLLCQNGGKIANAIAKAATTVIGWLPEVLLLMILFYVVFGKLLMDAVWVSIICFSLTYGCSMLSMINAGVGSINKGQFEASYSLGYTKTQTFFRILLPQAATNFIPQYKDTIISHVKSTSVVGFIAVTDLTCVSDIIRVSTYRAFFPLISVALIYCFLAWILVMIIRRIQFKIDPKKRKKEKILKGVKTDS